MAYCITSDVQQDMKDFPLSETTNVKLSSVTGFIAESDALIDAYVGNKYVVPVITGDLGLLKLLSRSITVARIKGIMEVKQQTSTDANQNVVSVLLNIKRVMEILEDLKNGDATLPGATPLSANGNFYSNNASHCVKPFVKKDETQW